MTAKAVASLVLAAGAASRFGSPKQLADLGGFNLLELALVGACEMKTAKTFVVLRANAAMVQARTDLGAAEVVLCRDWTKGTSSSLRAGLRALGGEFEAALVTLADEPFVDPVAGRRLIEARGNGAPALRATYGGRPGHPVLVERELFTALCRDDLRNSPGEALEAAGIVTIDCSDLGHPFDIDTRAQLDQARRLLDQRASGKVAT